MAFTAYGFHNLHIVQIGAIFYHKWNWVWILFAVLLLHSFFRDNDLWVPFPGKRRRIFFQGIKLAPEFLLMENKLTLYKKWKTYIYLIPWFLPAKEF